MKTFNYFSLVSNTNLTNNGQNPFFFFNNDDDDAYSPTSWDRGYGESDDDYNDRMQDQEDMLDRLND